jgi:MoaA/NifB/PqqE/SkfB family radical SAM enzyme
MKEKTPVVLQCLLIKENLEDVKRCIEFAGAIGIHHVNLVRLQEYPGLPIERPPWKEEQTMIRLLKLLGAEKKVQVRSLNHQPLAVRLATGFDRICLKTDDSLYILQDGTVTPCCNLRSYSIGSLKEFGYDLTAIWNGERERDFFKNQRNICGACDALFHTYRTK